MSRFDLHPPTRQTRRPADIDELWKRIVEEKKPGIPLREVAKRLNVSAGSVLGLWHRRGPRSPRSPSNFKPSKD